MYKNILFVIEHFLPNRKKYVFYTRFFVSNVILIELINKIKTKKAAKRAYKQSNSCSDYLAFLNLTSHCKSLAKN